MGKYQKNIEAARRITVMQYLETYHPGELVRKTDREYCTRTHDSLIITPANGFFHWFSRNVGGNNAIDYLTKVEGMDFVSAVRLLNEMAPVTVSFQPAKAAPVKPHEPRPFTLPTPDRNVEAVAAYLMHRGISPKVLRYLGCSQGNEGASLKELIEAACNEVDPPDVVIHTDEKVDVIPASIQLSDLQRSLTNTFMRECVMQWALEPFQGQYDYCLIDCMPELGNLVTASLAAADRVLIPVQPLILDVEGLASIIGTIRKIRRKINPKLEIDGVLITMADHRTNMTRDMYLELWEGNYLTKTAQLNLTWDAVAAKIADLIEQGRLMVPIKATPVQQQMEQLTLTPEDSEKAGLPSHEQQAKSIDLAAEVKKWNKPIIDASGKYITEQDITDVLCRGSGFEDGKFRIQQYLSAQVLPIEEDQARWLKKKYGIGGGTWFFRDGGRGFLNHMGKNLEITRRTEDGEYRRVLKWKEVAQRLRLLVYPPRKFQAAKRSRKKLLNPSWAKSSKNPAPLWRRLWRTQNGFRQKMNLTTANPLPMKPLIWISARSGGPPPRRGTRLCPLGQCRGIERTLPQPQGPVAGNHSFPEYPPKQ